MALPIHPNVDNLLKSQKLNIEQLGSISLKRGEMSERTKIANWARGADQRYLDLFRECEKICMDYFVDAQNNKETLSHKEKENLKANANTLMTALNKSENQNIQNKAAEASINIQLIFKSVFWRQ